MAQVAIKSTAVTNSTATPPVQNPIGIEGGRVTRAVNGLVTLTSGNTEAATLAAGASTYRAGKIRSSDYYDMLRIVTTADAGTTTVVDVGLYDISSVNSGAVIDQDFFCSSLSLKDGAIVTTGTGVNASNQTFEAGAAGGLITNAEKRVWECLGLTSDPHKEYDVVLTLTGACDGTATALVQVYVIR
jgi:hypothetical protein